FLHQLLSSVQEAHRSLLLDFPGFDSSSAKIWIYPTNYPIREYQLKISEAALFQNTLVCLPTGLGKTFIASVVMYNFYRWYPSGKIVFMAPTKPLVAQQIEACYKVMGIPQAHMAELTGTTGAKQRQEMWRSKRVFFLTPQIMCVVIDEAHKALGNHAYCQVIRQLGSQTQQFRILALSATPGGDSKSVQSVISNLLISHIELRSEESPDIRAHSHQRSVEKIVVPLGEALSAQQARYLQVLEKFMLRLITNRVMSHKDLRTLTKYQLILARDQFRKNPPSSIKGGQQGMLEGDFALCISLYHGYELLMQMGLRSLFFYIQGIMDGSREMSRARNELQRTPTFMDLYREMEAMFMKPSAGPDEPFVYSHPKLQKLEHVVQQHFTVWAKTSAVTTRVMIFSSFRESVQEIAEMLNRHAPLIRVMTFMGQASAGKGVKGFTQKEQLEVVHRFRQGGFNTLVSTCVGEEGLDIGEVDLIVCFDAQKSPIRLVQRMGRTGRKRQGRIVIILAEGREEKIYNQSQSNKRSVYKSILSNKSMFHMYPNSPRMLPEGVKPALHKMHITCGQFDHQENSRLSARGRRSHSEGQSSKSDGFLSSTEYALWESTMKLKEDEAHPTLKQSHFLSIPADPPPQEGGSKNGPPSRELSLWEWRHWQHKVFPTHVVDHSLRCNHFIKVMELIDTSHSTLSDLEYLDEEAEGDKPERKTSLVSMLTFTKRRSENDIKAPYENFTDCPGTEEMNPLPSESDSPENGMDEVCAETERENLDKITQLITKTDESEDVELEAMFYLPKWDTAPLPSNFLPGKENSLEVILANVAELLSRSPPSPAADFEADTASVPPPQPLQLHPPYQVSFTLDVDDDDEDDDVVMSDADNASSACVAANSPTWDEVFGDEEEEEEPHLRAHSKVADGEMCNNLHGVQTSEEAEKNRDDVENNGMPDLLDEEGKDDNAFQCIPQSDNSMDLFGDDDAFLQMSTLDIPTPAATHQDDQFASDISNSTKNMTNTSQIHDSSDPCCRTHTLGSSHRQRQTDKLVTHTQQTNISNTTKHSPNTKTLSSVMDSSGTNKVFTAQLKSPTLQQNFDVSHEYFSVNFDLGYSLDSEDDTDVEAAPLTSTSPRPKKQTDSLLSLPTISNSSTPYTFTRQRMHTQFSESKSSPAKMFPECSKRERSPLPTSTLVSKSWALPSPITSPGARRTLIPGPAIGRQFLDEEAELSEGADVSSDEEDGEAQNQSLDGFVVDNMHFSQGLNDSEMHGVYLKSVRSPVVHGKFKMSYRKHHVDIFSQVAEMDETYAEDSFVVGNEVEEVESSAEEAEDIELMPEDSYIDGRRQYATRRRVFLHKVRAEAKTTTEAPPTKRNRVLRIEDSSDEGTEEGNKVTTITKVLFVLSCRCRQRLEEQHLLSDELDFNTSVSEPLAPLGSVSILADSRCISTGVDLMTSLRHRHSATVHVCSLDGSYFIVSNRMAVERHSQSDLAAVQNRKRLAERMSSLQRLFERICLIVERDRSKPGDASRPFQRTRFYDSTIAGLVRTGVHLLWSDGAEESAGLLADIARLEQRKGHAITVPLEVKGQHREQALQLYLGLPSVNYAHALNMSHNFKSIAQLINSSVEAIQKGGCMNQSRAEEIYRALRYSCDSFFLNTSKAGKNS
uniref:FA complementation group M n=1 Tax=Echeneis naucrates TaxID=173247 RepID=A0A665UZR2_ECHNA